MSRSTAGGPVQRIRDERGQVLWMTGLLVFAFIGLAGLTTDVGAWLTGDRIAQKGADAAALAGARMLAAGGTPGSAQAAALANAASNGVTITFPTSGVCSQTGVICVAASKTLPGFSKLFGISGSTRTKTAAAAAAGVGTESNVVPFLFTTALATRWQPGSPTYSYTFDDSLGLPGSFGLVNLCGVNTPSEASCIETGCGCTLHVGDTVPTDPGNNWNANAIKKTALNTILNEQIYVPVGSPSGNGFVVAGFALFTMTAFNVSGSSTTITGTSRASSRAHRPAHAPAANRSASTR
jgi:Flp pilus assembly protein TadG